MVFYIRPHSALISHCVLCFGCMCFIVLWQSMIKILYRSRFKFENFELLIFKIAMSFLPSLTYYVFNILRLNSVSTMLLHYFLLYFIVL